MAATTSVILHLYQVPTMSYSQVDENYYQTSIQGKKVWLCYFYILELIKFLPNLYTYYLYARSHAQKKKPPAGSSISLETTEGIFYMRFYFFIC